MFVIISQLWACLSRSCVYTNYRDAWSLIRATVDLLFWLCLAHDLGPWNFDTCPLLSLEIREPLSCNHTCYWELEQPCLSRKRDGISVHTSKLQAWCIRSDCCRYAWYNLQGSHCFISVHYHSLFWSKVAWSSWGQAMQTLLRKTFRKIRSSQRFYDDQWKMCLIMTTWHGWICRDGRPSRIAWSLSVSLVT